MLDQVVAIASYSTVLLTFKNSWVAFAVCFGSSSICTMKRLPINFAKKHFLEVVWLLANSNLALFAPCGGPSVFALDSLLLIVWQWHTYLLESVLLLAGCCERVLLYHGEDPLIIHHCCPLWTSRHLYVTELTSGFFFLRIYQTCWFGISLRDLFSFWSLTIVSFTCMERSFDRMMWVHSNSLQMQMAQLQTFYMLIWCRNNKIIVHAYPWNSF